MPSTLPIRKLVLYKHGVATVTRRGKVEATEIPLPFRADELDDALKSLTAWTLDGGQVTGVHYPTPPTTDVPGIPVQLEDDDALFGIVRSLRGVPVTLKLEGGKIAQGRVVGIEGHPQGRKRGAMVVVSGGEGSLQQIATDRIVTLQIDDQRASGDITRYLDVAGASGGQRDVRLSLSEPGREVELSYTIPNPVWRVSYRFVAHAGAEHCLVQGWAIFDNRFDDDLEDAEVSLVAGQPVSFRYDLTSSVTPQRPVVRDEARVAAGPVEFEDMATMTAAAPAPAGDQYDMPAFITRRPSVAMAHARKAVDLAQSTQLLTESTDLDELFEYRVGSVSVRRGMSAMIPVVQHTVPYRRDLLYNGQKHPSHPVVCMRMRNETGLTLERGPATILEDGQYRGEAVVPFTKEGAELVLAYAVELGVRVVERTEVRNEVAAIELRDAFLHVQEYVVQETRYELTNTTREEQFVTVERSTWGDITNTQSPEAESAQYRRWRVSCDVGLPTSFTVVERIMQRREELIADQSLDSLSRYLQETILDTAVRRKLSDILLLQQAMAEIDSRIGILHAEQESLGIRQDRLRRNLEIQPANDEEVEIRRRSSQDFRRTQDREDELLAEIERLQADRLQAESDLDAELAHL